MPPSVPNPPEPSTDSISIREGEDHITSFFDLDGAGMALKGSDFDQEELFSILIGHIRDNDPEISLPAIRQFWTMSKDLLTLNGRLVSAHEQRTSPDGHTQSTSSTVLLSRLRGRRPPSTTQRVLPTTTASLDIPGATHPQGVPAAQPEPLHAQGGLPHPPDVAAP